MKVLRVITWLPAGGIERRLVALLPLLKAQGIEPELVCIRERGPLADDLEAAGVPVHCVPFKSRLDPRGLRGLTRLIREGNYDLVHAHMYRSNVPATLAAKWAGVPMLGQIHNVDTWQSWRQVAMDRFTARWRAGMIAVSERVAADVRQTLRLPHEKVHIIYNGVDIEKFAASPDEKRTIRERMRTELEINPEAVVVTNPARLHPQKNHMGLLDAWGEVLIELKGKNALTPVLLLPGDGRDRERLEKRLATDEAAGRLPAGSVRLLGHRDDMRELYHASDILALPSFKEGFSNALIEGMAAGLAPIATDVGGNAEAIEDGQSGLIIDSPENIIDLKSALVSLITNPDKRESMADAAALRSHKFSVSEMAKATHLYYQQTING